MPFTVVGPMYLLGRRIEDNAPLLAAGCLAILNILAVLGVWHPSGTTLGTLNATGAAVLAFLVQGVPSFQAWRIKRAYQSRAIAAPTMLLPSAGSFLDAVVGREDLCEVLMADLHDRGGRACIVVGDIGAGKTAVLVRLTKTLASRGAIPVPVSLQGTGPALDFEHLARERFLAEVNPLLDSTEEGETLWRQLIRDRKIVVMADDLESALIGTPGEPERDTIIHTAIRKARQQKLPLVLASRPQDLFPMSETATLMLGPLSCEVAAAFVADGESREEQRRLASVVETADVAGAPFFLQITRGLHVRGLLDVAAPEQSSPIGAQQADHSARRLELLRAWETALVHGHLREDVPLNWAERQAALEHLSALACAGLLYETRDVLLDLFRGPELHAEVSRRLAALDEAWGQAPGVRNIDVRLAAAWGSELGLVELRGNRVRFTLSTMQAYLGSRLLGHAIAGRGYWDEAVRFPRPGRGFLLALVLLSRADNGWPVVEPLRRAAAQRDDDAVLDIYGTALEIDCVAAEPVHATLAEEIGALWPRVHAQNPQSLENSKLDLIRHFGESARAIDQRRRSDGCLAEPAYRTLFEIACKERSFRVQFAAVQEIGMGGDSAYQAVRRSVAIPCQACRAEQDDAVLAGTAGQHRVELWDADSKWREGVISAWLAPVLVASVSSADRLNATADLARWLGHLGPHRVGSDDEGLPVSLEIALAQGFKLAANRRPTDPRDRQEARDCLAERALQMLKNTRFWYAQLTLIQALCLLKLSEVWPQPESRNGASPEAITRQWLDVAGSAWAEGDAHPPSHAKIHPFVTCAGELAAKAIRTGRPELYCWLDEDSVISQVGSRSFVTVAHGNERHWIPPSAGWVALDGRAQQLVADVLLLVNLADRGEELGERDRLLRRTNRADLPPCLTRRRDALEPGRSVGMAVSSDPGGTCVDGCAFELCPYPPKGAQLRAEMSEAFCRRQQNLLKGNALTNHKAPWQEMHRRQLRLFWADMIDRERGSFDKNIWPERR